MKARKSVPEAIESHFFVGDMGIVDDVRDMTPQDVQDALYNGYDLRPEQRNPWSGINFLSFDEAMELMRQSWL